MNIKNDFIGGEALSLIRHSWSVSWPMILIMFFDFFINLTDVYIAGRLDKDVQASVGFVSHVYFLFVVVANALTVGSVSVLSRLYTSGDRERFSRAVYSVVVTALTAGVMLSVAGVALVPAVIGVLNLPGAVKKYGIPLGQIYAAGLAFHYFLINSNGILRSSKRIRRSMFTMSIVCALNVGLNFLLVFYTPLGYRGIAVSTVASIAAGCALNYPEIKRLFAPVKQCSRAIITRVLRVGWPTGLLQAAWQLGSIMLFLILSALPEQNTEVIAAFTNGLRIEAAIFLPAFALNMANAVIVGNFLGERRFDNAYKSGLTTALIGVMIISVMTAMVIFNARSLSAFLSKNGVVVNESVRYLYISMISEPVMAWAVILGGALNGAGDTRGVMAIVIGSQWLVRLPLAYLTSVVFMLGPSAVWWSMNASILVHAVFITMRYRKRRWLDDAN